MLDIPFDSQNLQMLTECSLEPCVPNIVGLPIRRSDGRTNEVVPIGQTIGSYKGVDHRLKLVEIVLRSVGGWTMSVPGVEIRLVSYLETNNVATEDPLALCDDLQSQV